MARDSHPTLTPVRTLETSKPRWDLMGPRDPIIIGGPHGIQETLTLTLEPSLPR